MSSWKKASKVNQRTYRERHQPSDRAHLGLLEKHKDYIPRARDYQCKRNTLRNLKEHALNRNPDEYYHHMVNSRLVDDRHKELKKPDSEDTVEQKKIMEQKNLTYVRMKYVQEKKKAEKMQAQLHFIDNPLTKPKLDELSLKVIQEPKSLPSLKEINKARKLKERSYKKLMNSLERTKKLAVITEKMEVQRQLQKTKGSESRPKLVVPGTKTTAPVYKWKYERKR